MIVENNTGENSTLELIERALVHRKLNKGEITLRIFEKALGKHFICLFKY